MLRVRKLLKDVVVNLTAGVIWAGVLGLLGSGVIYGISVLVDLSGLPEALSGFAGFAGLFALIGILYLVGWSAQKTQKQGKEISHLVE